MSGLEVAGVVLGALPILVKALEQYAQGVRTIRKLWHYKYELETHSLALRAELAIFQNVLTWVLAGFASPTKIEELISSPESAVWKDDSLVSALQDRLGTSTVVFVDIMSDLDQALKDFKARLGLDEGGKAPCSDKRSLKEAVKAGKVVFAKGSCNDLMERIKEDNRRLKELSRQSTHLPTQTRRSRTTSFELLREYASQLYKAVENAFTCTCISKHRAGLHLGSKTSSNMPQSFGVMLSKASSGRPSPSEWIPFSIEMMEQVAAVSVRATCGSVRPPSSGLPVLTMQSVATRSRARKSVAFMATGPAIVAMSASSSSTMAALGTKMLRQTAESDIPDNAVRSGRLSELNAVGTDRDNSAAKIENLCMELEEVKTGCKPKSLGPVAGGSAEFLIKNSDMSIQGIEPIPMSLHDIVGPKRPSTCRLTKMEKLNLCVALSTAVLSLNQTPWMPDELTKHDVMILKQQKDCAAITYITTHLGAAGSSQKPSNIRNKALPASIENLALFSLGIVLIELLFGTSILDLYDEVQDPKVSGLDLQYAIASRLLREEDILQEHGVRCERAVRVCIKSNFGPDVRRHDLNDRSFRSAVYEHVVAQLEDCAREFGGVD